VKFGNAIWCSLTQDNVSRPDQDFLKWDLMMGNPGEAQIQYMKFSLEPQELSKLKTKPLTLYKPDGEILEILSATLVTFPDQISISEPHNLALRIGKTLIGGWSSPFEEGESICMKASLMENYSYYTRESLVLVSDRDLTGLDSKAVIYITYQILR